MTNNNHNAVGCGFAEQLVAYLYEEASSAEKSSFERHLRECSGCADEVAEFSGVRMSVQDWKTSEFDTLRTPAFTMPFEKEVTSAVNAPANDSWLSALRNLFTLSPAWSLATASAAVVAVTLGLVIFAMRGSSSDEVAGTNKNTKPVVSAPTPPDNNTPAPTPPKVIEPAEPAPKEPELAGTDRRNAPRPVKAVAVPRATPKSDAPKPKDNKRPGRTDDDSSPLADEDEEDDSLRLAELFDEIDTD